MRYAFYRFDVIAVGGGSVGMGASHRLAPTAGPGVPAPRSRALEGCRGAAEAMCGGRCMWSYR